MNKSEQRRHIHTSPIAGGLGEPMDPATALVKELGNYETRLKDARHPILAKRRKAREKCEAATEAGKVDISAAVASAFTEILTDGELGDVYFWRYVAKKLRIVAEVGALEVARDAELVGLRRFMRSIK